MNTNATIRDATSAHAAQLSATIPNDIIKHNSSEFASVFTLHYIDTVQALKDILADWTAKGGDASTLSSLLLPLASLNWVCVHVVCRRLRGRVCCQKPNGFFFFQMWRCLPLPACVLVRLVGTGALIEPADGFHPSQTAQTFLAKWIWNKVHTFLFARKRVPVMHEQTQLSLLACQRKRGGCMSVCVRVRWGRVTV